MNKREVRELKRVRELLEMKTASFHEPGNPMINWGEKIFTDKVREATRIWRETWILPVLDELIAKYEKKFIAK